MSWTQEMKVDYLMMMPWTFSTFTERDGDFVIRVREIPAASGCGETTKAAESEVWEALRAAIKCYLHFGDPIPVPRGLPLPWESAAPNRIPGKIDFVCESAFTNEFLERSEAARTGTAPTLQLQHIGSLTPA